MPGRLEPFVSGNYYHVFNRGVAKQDIFLSEQDYSYALLCLKYYRFVRPPVRLSKLIQLDISHQSDIWIVLENSPKLVDIVAFVFMPNHWHMLLKQISEEGVSRYLSLFSNSYSRYFNVRHHRIGPLFQGAYKTVTVDTEEQLLHLSRYIHLNPAVSGLVNIHDLASYQWSSYPAYIHNHSTFINRMPIITNFSRKISYEDFVVNQFDYARQLELVKHQLIDVEV